MENNHGVHEDIAEEKVSNAGQEEGKFDIKAN